MTSPLTFGVKPPDPPRCACGHEKAEHDEKAFYWNENACDLFINNQIRVCHGSRPWAPYWMWNHDAGVREERMKHCSCDKFRARDGT